MRREMTGTFMVSIQLGNDAMQSARDIADALRVVANRVEDGVIHGKVMDVNGNWVGSFSSSK